MQGFVKQGIALVGIGFLAGFSTTAVQGCDSSDVCGPCGSIATGQVSVSGNAQLDGFFAAVADLGKATTTIKGEFDANVRALASLYGMVDANAVVDAAFVADLKAKIQADFQANVSGGLRIVYKPPECKADINVAVEAQASCEAQAECDVNANPGMVSVECSGTCEGSCSGTCMGEVSCKTPSAGISCSGECEGSCELSGAASCDGTCHGDCSGNCSAMNAAGECHGSCDADCTGSCEFTARASCMGTCHGTCYAMADPGGCEGDVGCSGSCMGQCSGDCKGEATPPSASADCDASADCQAQAKAQASANVECTPPRFDWEFEFAAGVNAEAQAAFIARLSELRVRGAAIIAGFAKASALITGEFEGEVIFDHAPVAALTASIEGLISAGVKGDFDIPAGRIACVIPALKDAGKILGSAATDFTATISLQAQVAGALTNPMGG